MKEQSNIKILFGKRVKELRIKAGMTQSHLSELVDVDSKHISCIESGKSFPSADLIVRLSAALDIEPKDLFEYYHLQDSDVLKSEIINLVQTLQDNEIKLAYKYIRNFIR